MTKSMFTIGYDISVNGNDGVVMLTKQESDRNDIVSVILGEKARRLIRLLTRVKENDHVEC